MRRQHLRSSKGIVSAAAPEGAKAGAQVLREGGNAVDAAVAAAATVAVAEPPCSGFGGYGGAMIVHIAGQTVCVDSGARAPAAAWDGMFELERIEDGEMYARGGDNRTGPRACGIAPILSGLALALEQFGTIPLSRALEPAIELCERGIAGEAVLEAVRGQEELIRRFPATAAIMLPGGQLPSAENPIVQRDLAGVLREVREDGVEAFYEGRVADLVDAHTREVGGIMRWEDWSGSRSGERSYKDLARIVEPICAQYRDWEIATAPECTGGPTVAQIVRLAHHLKLQREPRDSARYAHLLAEAMKTAWRDRLSRYGDPDLCDCDLDRLLADERLVAQASQILARKTVTDDADETCWEEDAGGEQTADGRRDACPTRGGECTTHIGVVDRWGNVVSFTQTHGSYFGCGVTIPGTGILLNNAMSRFDPRPGRPNSVGPGKRILHNMAPTLVLRDGKPLYSLGLPGGRKIASVVAQYVLDLLDRGASPVDALWSAKVHAEACEPVLIEGERMSDEAWAAQENHYSEADFSLTGGKKRGWPPWTLSELEALGHQLRLAPNLGGTGHVLKISAALKTAEGANGPLGWGHLAEG